MSGVGDVPLTGGTLPVGGCSSPPSKACTGGACGGGGVSGLGLHHGQFVGSGGGAGSAWGGKISAHSAVQEAYLVLHEVGQRGGQKFELLVKLHPCRHSEHSVRRIIVEQQLLHDHRDFSSTSAPSVSRTGGEVSGSARSCPGAGCGCTGGLALFSSSLPHPFPHPPGRGGMLSGARSREGS